MPRASTVKPIADYFGVSVDYLADASSSFSNITASGDHNIIGNGNTVSHNLTEQESTLLDIFRRLDVVGRARLLSFAADLVQ